MPLWEGSAEEMHLLSFKELQIRTDAIQEIFHQAKVLVFTVYAFIQIASGQSNLSKMFRGFRWKYSIVDEAHQLAFYQVASVAFRVNSMLLVGCVSSAAARLRVA